MFFVIYEFREPVEEWRSRQAGKRRSKQIKSLRVRDCCIIAKAEGGSYPYLRQRWTCCPIK